MNTSIAGHVLDLTPVDYSYQTTSMGPLAAGPETIRLHNGGTQPHQATIVRLHDGVTSGQFDAALHQANS